VDTDDGDDEEVEETGDFNADTGVVVGGGMFIYCWYAATWSALSGLYTSLSRCMASNKNMWRLGPLYRRVCAAWNRRRISISRSPPFEPI
jgi:hypothetical protein